MFSKTCVSGSLYGWLPYRQRGLLRRRDRVRDDPRWRGTDPHLLQSE